MKYNLLVFDLDGTLLETLEDLAEAVNYALDCSSLPLHSLDEYRKMVGHGVRNLVRSALPEEMRDESNVDLHLARFKKYYTEHIDAHTKPYPGISALLEALTRQGSAIAVASNKFQEGTEALISEFFPEIPFVSVMGNREGSPLKPDPQIIHSAMAAAGLSASARVAMIGDSATDIATGHNAGVETVAVSWGFRPRESLEQAGPDAIADNVDGLAALLLG
ncbi:MAG: HAD family hydrolase [Bacteroidales bacterium]|nr:HAD family hydrolase [Bacteroidales bacterium]